MNDVCRFSRNHVVECSERTVLSCLEPVCLCWRRFRSISQNVANINKLVQDKTKLFIQNILQHGIEDFQNFFDTDYSAILPCLILNIL